MNVLLLTSPVPATLQTSEGASSQPRRVRSMKRGYAFPLRSCSSVMSLIRNFLRLYGQMYVLLTKRSVISTHKLRQVQLGHVSCCTLWTNLVWRVLIRSPTRSSHALNGPCVTPFVNC